jgi:hypothetical protein
MSRTYRRKDLKSDISWVGSELQWLNLPYSWGAVRVPMIGGKLVKALAEYHSDAYHNFKEPGPTWWRNTTAERPQRRINKRELQKFMLDPEYEPMCFDMVHLVYWT